MNALLNHFRNKSTGLIIIAILLPFMAYMVTSCGGGGEGNNSSTNNSLTPPELGLVINSIEIDDCPNVKVYLSVTDENGNLIEDDPVLTAQLFEDGIEQTNNFSLVWQGDTQMPMSIVFAMDYSKSMSEDSITAMENGVKSFVDAMNGQDKAAIIKFFYQPQVITGLTSDKSTLYNAVDTAPDSRDYTNIYDTVVEAASAASGGEGRLAVILLTDGEHLVTGYPVDNTLEEAVNHSRQLQVPIFSIALGLRDDSDIKYISQETGGIYFPILDSSVIDDVYQTLYQLLDQQHLITYTSNLADDLQHSIQLSAEYYGVTGDSIILNFNLCPAP